MSLAASKRSKEEHNYIREMLKASTVEKLTEASLGRIFFNIKDRNSSFAIITYRNSAYVRDEDSGLEKEKVADNKAAKQKFFAMLKEMGLGTFKLIGHGLKGHSENLLSIREPSYVIVDINLKQAEVLRSEFKQDGFIYVGPETKDEMWLVGVNGQVIDRWNEFNALKAAEFYSRIRGRKYAFEGIPWSVQEGLWTQTPSHCSKISGIKRWQELAEEGMENPRFFDV